MGVTSAWGATLAAWLRSWLPRNYVRVERDGASFICELNEAVDHVCLALEARGEAEGGAAWAWRNDRLVIGSTQFTFVRMSPRRFEALGEWEGC